MRKLVSALAVATGLTLVAGPALAQNYPPDTQKLTVSESTVSPGESFTVSGDGAEGGATVSFTLKGSSGALGGGRAIAAGPGLARVAAAVRPQAQSAVPLGSTTANASGEFSATLTIPSSTDPGGYTVTAASGGDVLAVVTIRVAAAGGVGDLPFTGGNVLPGLAIGATLILAGGLLLLSLKRRRSAA
jgi:LPXTG cell wall anchor motif